MKIDRGSIFQRSSSGRGRGDLSLFLNGSQYFMEKGSLFLQDNDRGRYSMGVALLRYTGESHRALFSL